MSGRYTACGKKLIRDGEHIGDLATLKPCPWCGPSGDVRAVEIASDCHVVRCKTCLCEGPSRQMGTKAEAIAAWNTRSGRLVPQEEDDETYQIGVDDGRQEMAREIDIATGGDGEFRWSTEPERHCPDPEAMKANIVARFGQLVPVPSVERVARVIADQLGDDYDMVPQNKGEWIKARGMCGGWPRDINMPFRSDYDAAATAIIAAMQNHLNPSRRLAETLR